MWNRMVRVGWVLGLWGLTMFCGGCLRSHGPGEAANPGGNDATDGDGVGGEPRTAAPGCTLIEIAVTNLDSLDLLFVIDDSESMREEQAALRAQLTNLADVLTTGDRDGDGMQDQPPVRDLHLGVVSADLGAAGLEGVPGCTGLGDDAVLQHVGDPERSGCASAFPRFLRYEEGETNATQLGNDFGCMASLGTAGCAIEQPLEAALRALWPAQDQSLAFAASADGSSVTSHGDQENAGFTAVDGRVSALGIVIVTDEDDCSVEDAESFAAAGEAEPANLRCFSRPHALFDTRRYASALRRLRGDDDALVFFGAIVGVPDDLVNQAELDEHVLDTPEERDAHYQAILDDPRMQQAVDPDSTLEGAGGLVPSCSVDNDGDRQVESRAIPPRRIVEVVRQFGTHGFLASICQKDFSPVLQPMLDAIGHRVRSVCLQKPRFRDESGLVPDCEARWRLPVSSENGVAPTHCSERPWLELVDHADDGGEICRVQQLPLVDGQIAAGAGWFFDPKGGPDCPEDSSGAVFTAEATPPTGVTVELECCD